MKTKRLFVAIDLPKSTEELLSQLDPRIPGARWVHPRQMHVTLGFFGYVVEDVARELREKLETIQFRAFFLPITGLGKFPAKGSPKIIWVGVGSAHPHLFQLHKRVQEAALAVALEPDLRPWHPHVTLARCRDVRGGEVEKFLHKHSDFDAGMIRVEEFHLYSSELTPAGSIYTRETTVRAA